MKIAELIKGKSLRTLSFPLLSSVPGEIGRIAVKEGEHLLSEPMDHLTLSLYKSFTHIGSRTAYETPYFRKRKRLSSLVLAEAIERKGRFMDRIEDEIWSLFSEPGWAIPAHNSYVRDTPQLPVPETGRPVLDLFAMESAEIIALSYAILSDELTPSLMRTMESEITRRIVVPYLSSWFWWMGNGKEKLNNWTVWCTQNVLLTVLAMPFDAETRGKVAMKAASSLDDWYSQYGDDGCCDEGAQYWHASPLCYFGSVSILDEATGGALGSVYSESKVRNMAAYIMNVHVAGDRYLNFADCSPCAGPLGAREYLFGKAVGNRALMRQAMLDSRTLLRKSEEEGHPCFLYDNDYNLWYGYLAYGLSGTLLYDELPEEESLPSFIDYRSVGIAIYRKDDVVLAVKSGCNDDSHNHNDTGSLILYRGSHPLLADIGVETYTKTTFSPERYTLFPMQSLYHNVVNFGGVGQSAGAEFRAEQVKADAQGISMELSRAYPEGTVGSYIRKVMFNGHGITVSDRVGNASDPVLSLITMDRPAADGDGISFDGWRIGFIGAESITVETIDIRDPRLRIAWPDKLYRSLVSFSGQLDWTITM